MRLQRLIGLGLFVIAMGAALAAQTAQQRPTFRSGVDLIEVDVSVIDGDGRPIADLEASDFSVTVDGNPRRVVQAQFISLRPPEPDARQPAPAAEEVFSSSNTDQTPGRLIVIAVDEASMLFGEGRHVMRSAGAFVDSLNPADRVALVAVPQPGVYIDFTSDHDRVRRAVAGMSGLGSRPSDFMDINVWEAFRIAEYQDGRVTAAVVTRECEYLGCAFLVEQESRRIVQDARYHSDNTLRGLESILDAMRELEGPKALLWISGGFVIDGDVSILREIETLAAASRTTLYVMMVDEPLIDMSRASSPDLAARSGDRRMKEQGLRAVAALTRGSLMRAHYNPGPLFDRLERELSGYYLLGVQSRLTDPDKERRRIKVSVERKDARVRARREISFTPEDPHQSVDERLALMLRSPISIQELPLRVATYTHRDPESGQMRVFAAAEVAGGVSSPLTFGVMLRDSDGTVVFTRQQVNNHRL